MSVTAETLPKLHRLSVTDYHRMGETGVLGPEDRTELIEGTIIDMTPIGSRHAGTVRHLATLMHSALKGAAIISEQAPLILGSDSEPQPDIAVLKSRADFYKTGHPGPGDVLMLVEVSDTSRDYDRQVKLPLYARFAIPELWLLDLSARIMEIHRDPAEAGYQQVQNLGPADLAAVPVPGLPGIQLDLGGLF